MGSLTVLGSGLGTWETVVTKIPKVPIPKGLTMGVRQTGDQVNKENNYKL